MSYAADTHAYLDDPEVVLLAVSALGLLESTTEIGSALRRLCNPRRVYVVDGVVDADVCERDGARRWQLIQECRHGRRRERVTA